MKNKIIAKCIKSTKPMLVPTQTGNSKVFISNIDTEEFDTYEIDEVIKTLKPYLTDQQLNYSTHLITNWEDTKILHELMSITLNKNPKIQDINHQKLWNVYTTWIFETMLKELKNSTIYKGKSTSREGWQSDRKRPYYWGCMIDGFIFAYGFTHLDLRIDTMISKEY